MNGFGEHHIKRSTLIQTAELLVEEMLAFHSSKFGHAKFSDIVEECRKSNLITADRYAGDYVLRNYVTGDLAFLDNCNNEIRFMDLKFAGLCRDAYASQHHRTKLDILRVVEKGEL